MRHIVVQAGLLALMLLGGFPQAEISRHTGPVVASDAQAHGAATATLTTAPEQDPAAGNAVVPARALPLPLLVENESSHGPAGAAPAVATRAAQASDRFSNAAAHAAARHATRRTLRVSRLHLFCVYRL